MLKLTFLIMFSGILSACSFFSGENRNNHNRITLPQKMHGIQTNMNISQKGSRSEIVLTIRNTTNERIKLSWAGKKVRLIEKFSLCVENEQINIHKNWEDIFGHGIWKTNHPSGLILEPKKTEKYIFYLDRIFSEKEIAKCKFHFPIVYAEFGNESYEIGDLDYYNANHAKREELSFFILEFCCT